MPVTSRVRVTTPRSPGHIISRLKPECPRLGLTRIENYYVMVPVTDRVNLPHAAMQPNSGHVNPV
jgi:hypothetical protein